jgi:hypothetical protein
MKHVRKIFQRNAILKYFADVDAQENQIAHIWKVLMSFQALIRLLQSSIHFTEGCMVEGTDAHLNV